MRDFRPAISPHVIDNEGDLLEKAYALKDLWVKERDPRVFEQGMQILEGLLSGANSAHRKDLVRLMALMLYDNDEFEKAVPYFRELAILEPHSEYASSNLSLALGQAGRFSELMDEMEDFLSRHPVGPDYAMMIEDEEAYFAQWLREGKLKGRPHFVAALREVVPDLREEPN